MEIKDLNLWYRFLVPIPYESSESEEQFLGKTKDCLESFFDKYTKMTGDRKKYQSPFRGPIRLESLTEEAWNFLEFELAGIYDCNVGFYVGTPQNNYGDELIGIDIFTSSKDEKKVEQKPMVDFLRKKWKEFDYKF